MFNAMEIGTTKVGDYYFRFFVHLLVPKEMTKESQALPPHLPLDMKVFPGQARDERRIFSLHLYHQNNRLGLGFNQMNWLIN